jgi:PAS domain S-box-containing protein
VLEAVAGISDALVIVDEHKRLVYQNPAAQKLLGPAPDICGGSAPYGLFLPDETTPFPAESLPLLLALSSGEDVRDVRMFVRSETVPSGMHVLASASPLRNSCGSVCGAACILRDITMIREQEVQLRESARQKKAILDNIPDMAWLKDENGCFLLVNQPLATVAGRASPEDVVGYTDAELWAPELAAHYRAQDEEIMRTRQHMRVEESFVDPEGKRVWLDTFKTAIVDDEGRVIGTTGLARDITERKFAEEKMRHANDELERRMLVRTAELAEAQGILVRQERLAVIGQLAGGVAHQIRNPLAAIMNATYVLRRHLAPNQHENVEDAIRIIHDEVRHANIIITGLLDYARVRTPNRNPTSIVDVLERILDADWIPPNIRIIRQIVPEDSAVICEVDADQLQGAISNIVRNAVDAMPDGGDLVIKLAATDEATTITVSDNGKGISPQVRDRLFEPLHSTKPMGIGLGLVTARRFVESHGGTIASIDVPEGACFEIRIPNK